MKKDKKVKKNMITATDTGLLNTQGAAEYLKVEKKFLENLRSHKRGPKHIKQGRICLYNTKDLDEWLELRKGKKVRKSSMKGKFKEVKGTKGKRTRNTTSKKDVNINMLGESLQAIKANARTRTNDIAQNLNQMKNLIDSKTGFLVNKTDVRIFKNIMNTLISLDKEIELLKKKAG